MRSTKFTFCSGLFIFLTASSIHADFGNWFVANKRLPTPLNSSAKKFSYRFTCQDNTTLTAASIYCLDAIDPPAYQISLQEDETGHPSGNILAASSYVPRAASWSTLPLKN